MPPWALFQGAALPLPYAFPLTGSLHGSLAFAASVLPVTRTALSGGNASLYFTAFSGMT